MKLILQRSGPLRSLQTSDWCPLLKRGLYVTIHPFRSATDTGSVEWNFMLDRFDGQTTWSHKCSEKPEGFKALTRHLRQTYPGLPSHKFHQWTEAYTPGSHSCNDHYIAHCLYEEPTQTIRLHRSNVALVRFHNDHRTTCDGTPVVFEDAANTAYRPIIKEGIRLVRAQNCSINDRLWLTWIISEYIGNNVHGNSIHPFPALDGQPAFPDDLIPAAYPSLKYQNTHQHQGLPI